MEGAVRSQLFIMESSLISPKTVATLLAVSSSFSRFLTVPSRAAHIGNAALLPATVAAGQTSADK